MQSELHGVHLVVAGEAEAGAHVLHDARRLVSLQVLEQGVINRLLQGGALVRTCLLLVFVEYVSALGFGGLVLECSVSDLGNIGAGSIHLRARSDGVDLVDALEGNTVDFEGSADEEETGLELFEEDNSLAPISAGSENEHATCLNALAKLRSSSSLSANLTFLVLSRVPIELFDH